MSTNGGITWEQLLGPDTWDTLPQGEWVKITVDIPPGSSNTLFEFRYDTVDSIGGGSSIEIGWFLDDIQFQIINPPSCSILEEGECGNGELNQGETCDDGNQLPGDGCDASCRRV